MKKNIKTITTKAVTREINAMEEWLEAKRERAAARRADYDCSITREEEREENAIELRREKARLYRWARRARGSFPPSKVPKNIAAAKRNAKGYLKAYFAA